VRSTPTPTGSNGVTVPKFNVAIEVPAPTNDTEPGIE